MAKLFTKYGWLTSYAMTLGYRHCQHGGGVILGKLYPCDKPIYQIVVDKNCKYYFGLDWRNWEGFENGVCVTMTFESLPEARRVFKQILRGNLQKRFERNPAVMAMVIA